MDETREILESEKSDPRISEEKVATIVQKLCGLVVKAEEAVFWERKQMLEMGAGWSSRLKVSPQGAPDLAIEMNEKVVHDTVA